MSERNDPPASKPSRGAKSGMPPGALVHVGRKKRDRVTLTQIEYDATTFNEQIVTDIAALAEARRSPSITWINVSGLHEVDKIAALGTAFDLHPLLVEDMLNADQRPKIDQSTDSIYFVFKLLHWNTDYSAIESEQVSVVLGPRYLVTVQEDLHDPYDPLRARLRSGQGRLRALGADYLAYRLLDIAVDGYFTLLEQIGEQIEDLEEVLVDQPERSMLQAVYRLKRDLLNVRRAVWPLREVISQLQHADPALVAPATQIYLRDVYEHTVTVMETVETYRDVVAGLIDIYLSSISNRTNEVMKVLTIISTIFMPLAFLTGLYGMNFDYMPELRWRYGYPMVWGIALTVSLVLLYYFRRRDWL